MNRREFFNTLAVGVGAAVTTKALTPPCPAFPCLDVQPVSDFDRFEQVLTHKGRKVYWDDGTQFTYVFEPAKMQIVYLHGHWR